MAGLQAGVENDIVNRGYFGGLFPSPSRHNTVDINLNLTHESIDYNPDDPNSPSLDIAAFRKSLDEPSHPSRHYPIPHSSSGYHLQGQEYQYASSMSLQSLTSPGGGLGGIGGPAYSYTSQQLNLNMFENEMSIGAGGVGGVGGGVASSLASSSHPYDRTLASAGSHSHSMFHNAYGGGAGVGGATAAMGSVPRREGSFASRMSMDSEANMPVCIYIYILLYIHVFYYYLCSYQSRV